MTDTGVLSYSGPAQKYCLLGGKARQFAEQPSDVVRNETTYQCLIRIVDNSMQKERVALSQHCRGQL